MKRNKYNATWILCAILMILYEVFYPLISDVAAGETKNSIGKWLNDILVPMPSVFYVPLFLILITLLTNFLMKVDEVNKLTSQLDELKSDSKDTTKRLEKYRDDAILKKDELVAATKQLKKIDIINERMTSYVRETPHLLGIQIFHYSINATQTYVGRTAEYVDDTTSWEGKAYTIDAATQRDFHTAITNKREEFFIDRYAQLLTKIPKQNLTEKHVYQYACVNVASAPSDNLDLLLLT